MYKKTKVCMCKCKYNSHFKTSSSLETITCVYFFISTEAVEGLKKQKQKKKDNPKTSKAKDNPDSSAHKEEITVNGEVGEDKYVEEEAAPSRFTEVFSDTDTEEEEEEEEE